MIVNRPIKKISAMLITSVVSFISADAGSTDISTDPLSTYSATSSTDVKPNIFFVLDDSGSMDYDFMPDWACTSASSRNSNCIGAAQSPSSERSEYLFRNSSYNGIYYNPAVTYKPPIGVNSNGTLNVTNYPNMTGMSTTTGSDANSAKPNWKAVRKDYYGIQNALTSTANLEGDATQPPYYFVTVPGEYCSSPSLKNCISATNDQTVSGGVAYKYPAYLRWCDSAALTNCQAGFDDAKFDYARSPSPSIATITVSGNSNTSVSGMTVDGKQIMAGTAATSNDPSIVAQNIATQINLCTVKITGNCQTYGYRASLFGAAVKIIAPAPATSTPAITKSGSMSLAVSAFSKKNVPGSVIPTVITSTVNSYPYPGMAQKAATRTDCAGTTCTYVEEMTNYANWWTYYKSRMQMMKSAASNAFASIDTDTDMANNVSRFRLGYLSINNNTNSDFLNVDEFRGGQKYNWYMKIFQARPVNSTPIRKALATAGQFYAGKLTGTTLNGSTVADPLQYSCQQNYTILSTDGFWNEGSGYTKMDMTTNVGQQDTGLPPPYSDGSLAQMQTSTSTLQKRSGTLQARIYSGGKWNGWTNASQCSPGSTMQCQYSWGAWANSAGSCTVNYSSGTGIWTTAAGTDCKYTGWTTYANTSTCEPVAQSLAPNYTVTTAAQCNTKSPTGGASNTLADVATYYYSTDLRDPDSSKGTGTCTGPTIAPSTTANNLCENNVPANGKDVANTQHMTTFTLGLGSQGKMVYVPGVDYWKDETGDFAAIKNASTADSTTGVCSWQTNGTTCNWPIPASNSNANIDDLWHTAVNGRGTYFSATDPTSLATSLINALKTINDVPRPGASAAAASSNPNVTASDNYIFSSSYRSVEWYGELIRQRLINGVVTSQNWSAMLLVDCAMAPWKAKNSYAAGNVYQQGGKCYLVTKDYQADTTYDSSAGGLDAANTVVLYVDQNAATKVAVTAPTGRNIYTKGTVGSGNGLLSFDWVSIKDTALAANFTAPHITYVSDSTGLSQFCTIGSNCLSAAQKTNTTIATGGAAGEALVNYLRGDRSYEDIYFRKRVHLLGDIVSSEAKYVKTPLLSYLDDGYTAFKNSKKSRQGVVYVGANDGMLHAFNADSGQELWAYIPSFVLPDIYKLADLKYADKHQFFVDGSPQTADICPKAPGATCSASEWRTILVGGLNRGGKGYYALDITDPANPSLLWEFNDANLGYSYATPSITKVNGTWAVLFASGYNNADGSGRLYVVNAMSGALIRSISTGVGSTDAPSGLAHIAAYVPNVMNDNTTLAVYGGDLLGNLWRFDVNNNIGVPGYDAQLLASFTDQNGAPQSVTATPAITTINGKQVIYVGTGRYLGTTDVSNAQFQSFYAVKDQATQTSLGNPRSNSNFVKQTLTSQLCPEKTSTAICTPGQLVRTASNHPVDWGTKAGWYMDFLTGGERAATDPALGLGILAFTTITPQSVSVNVCSASAPEGAGSFLYQLNYSTGGALQGTNNVVAYSLGSALVSRPIMVQDASGNVRLLIRSANSSVPNIGSNSNSTVFVDSDENVHSDSGFISSKDAFPNPSNTTVKRVSWRVLPTQ